MRIVTGVENHGRDRPVALAIGNFDGVHRGHQWLLSEVTAYARSSGLASAVLVFRPHPRVILQPDAPRQFLTTPTQQRDLFGQLGLDVLVEQPFDRALAATDPVDFVAMLAKHLDLRDVWVGQDFQFGRNRSGNVDLLRSLGERFGFTVHAIERLTVDDAGDPISSSRVRRSLLDGGVETASTLLGRPYELAGLVVHGDARGRTIGVPTANLAPEPELVVPARGVYYSVVSVDGVDWPAGANIGIRPTVDGLREVIEAHLLGFDSDLYGQRLSIQFRERLRAEQRFDGLDALIAQIHLDMAQVRHRWDSGLTTSGPVNRWEVGEGSSDGRRDDQVSAG